MKLALVYVTAAGVSNVGFFDENGDINSWHAFQSNTPFEAQDDMFIICEHKESEESDFILSPLGQIQVTLNDGSQSKCTIEEFIADPHRDPGAYQVIYESALNAIARDKPEKLEGKSFVPPGTVVH